eukprot:m.125725 g.125725  ORF g.125725 m.125725 type:complete len:200 (+) comp16658_c1_seq1:111-710(+)
MDLHLPHSGLVDFPAQEGHSTEAINEINVEGNEIALIPESIVYFSGLTSLIVKSNLLTQLPACIGNLPNLMSLDISYNIITQLPDELAQCKRLKKLNAAANKLSHLSGTLCSSLPLEQLDVSGNALAALPEEFGALTTLVEFRANSNRWMNKRQQLDSPNLDVFLHGTAVVTLGLNLAFAASKLFRRASAVSQVSRCLS